MRIISTSAAWDGVSWIAKIANERAFRPIRFGFRASEPIAASTPLGPAFGSESLEEELVLKALQNGYPVYLSRTLAAPYIVPRRLIGQSYDPADRDQPFYILSETPIPEDVGEYIILPDAWPENLARVDYDRFERPAMFLGKSLDFGLQPYAAPQQDMPPGTGLTIRHNEHFTFSAAISEANIESSNDFMEFGPITIGSINKHHIILVLSNLLGVKFTTDRARKVTIKSTLGGAITEFVYSTSPSIVHSVNNGVVIADLSAGSTDIGFVCDVLGRRPRQLTITDTTTSEQWVVDVIDYDATIILQYQTTGGVWVSYGTKVGVSLPNEVVLPKPIIDTSPLSIMCCNLLTNQGNVTHKVLRWTSPTTFVEVDSTNVVYSNYPLDIISLPDWTQAGNYVYRYFDASASVTHEKGISFTVSSAGYFTQIRIPGDV